MVSSPAAGGFVRAFVDVVFGGAVRKGTSVCGLFSYSETSLFEAVWDPSLVGLDPAIWFADLDGDGLTEFVYAVQLGGAQVLHYRRNFGVTVDAQGNTIPLTLSAAAALDTMGDGSAVVGDVNRDGAVDLMYAPFQNSHWFWTEATSFPDGVNALRRSTGMMNGRLVGRQQWLFDLNNDGLIDLVEVLDGGGDLSIAYNSGNGFEPFVTFSSWSMPAGISQGDFIDNAVRFGDLNGDGIAEIIQMTGPGGRPNSAAISARSFLNRALQPVVVGYVGSAGILSGDQGYRGYSASTLLDANGDALTDLVQVEDGALTLYVSDGSPRHLMKAVTNGLGETINITRAPVSSTLAVQRTGCNPAGLAICLAQNRSVVHRVSRTSPAAGQTAVTTYTYDTPVFDVRVGKFVGFQSRTIQLAGGAGTVVEAYDLSLLNGFYPYASRPAILTHDVPLTANRARRTLTVHSRRVHPGSSPWWVEDVQTERSEYEYDPTTTSSPGAGDLVRRLTNHWKRYDDYGNALESTFFTHDNWSGSTVAVIPIDTANWFIRNGTRLTRTSTAPTGQSQTRVVEFTYTNSLARTVTIEPSGDCDTYLQRTYERHPDGQVWRISDSAKAPCNVATRSVTIHYDTSEGLWPERVINSMGHEEEYAYHAGLGVVGIIEDANGVQTRYQYDGFGRLKSREPPTNARVDWMYVRTQAGVEVSTARAGGPTVTDSYNALGLLVASSTAAFGDQGSITASVSYDVLGRPAAQFNPQYSGYTAVATVVSRDNLGRPTRIEQPDRSAVILDYVKHKVTRTDERGFHRVTEHDSLGLLTSVTEEWVGITVVGKVSTRYRYGPFSELAEVIDDKGSTRVYQRDLRGRVLEASDPYSDAASIRWPARPSRVSHGRRLIMILRADSWKKGSTGCRRCVGLTTAGACASSTRRASRASRAFQSNTILAVT